MESPDRTISWPTLGPLWADWVEAHCVVPDREDRGRPFRLYDDQLWFWCNHGRIKASAEPGQLSTAFVYRRSQQVLPQKAGKGPLTAAQVCVEAVGPALFAGWAEGGEWYDCRDHGCGCGFVYEYRPGEPMGRPWPTPLIQITATSEEQTANIYAALKPMIDEGPLSVVIPKTGEDFIRLPGGGRIDTVTSSATSRLGQRVTFCAQDETGIWTQTNRMVKVAETQRRGLSGMGGRAVETTNAWDPSENTVAQRTYEANVADVFRHFPQAPKSLSYTNKADRRKIHRFAYGDSLKDRGGHIDLDSIEAEAAEIITVDPAQAERFYGNRLVEGAGAWMPEALWRGAYDLGRQTIPDDGTSVCGGFDGSLVDDWTVIRLETVDGYQFTPRYGPDKRPTIWNPAEWNGSIPRGEVHAAWDELSRRYRLERIYLDPPKWESEIELWATMYGAETFIPWASYRDRQMFAALDRFTTDLATGLFKHDGCPITAQHVYNARKTANRMDRYTLAKPSQHQKIDAAMTSVLCHEAASDARAAGWTGESVDNSVFVFRR